MVILVICVDVYQKIYEIHSKGSCKYRFSEEARRVYEELSDNIVQEMNRQLEEDIILSDNMSKDRKIFIR